MTTAEYTAAWVPDDDPNRSWDEAADLAVEWVLEQARSLELAPLLVTPTQSQWSAGADSIRWFAQTYTATTPRSARVGSSRSAVLLYVPDYGTFHHGVNQARDGAVVVVESVSHPLLGWAVEVEALNLVTGERTADYREPELREQLDRLHWYGNNGWTRGFGRDQAIRILEEMRQQGHFDPQIVLGYMLAKGHHGKAVDRLAELIAKL